MRIKNLESKYYKRDVIIKAALSLLNVYLVSLNYLNNLNFLLFSLLFNSSIKKSTI